MTFSLPLDYPRNPFRYGSGNYLTYERLSIGPATGLELSKFSLSHTRRLSDLKERLRPLGWTIENKRVCNDPVIYEYWLAKIKKEAA
jgi:hypothetical protein